MRILSKCKTATMQAAILGVRGKYTIVCSVVSLTRGDYPSFSSEQFDDLSEAGSYTKQVVEKIKRETGLDFS